MLDFVSKCIVPLSGHLDIGVILSGFGMCEDASKRF